MAVDWFESWQRALNKLTVLSRQLYEEKEMVRNIKFELKVLKQKCHEAAIGSHDSDILVRKLHALSR